MQETITNTHMDSLGSSPGRNRLPASFPACPVYDEGRHYGTVAAVNAAPVRPCTATMHNSVEVVDCREWGPPALERPHKGALIKLFGG